MEHEEIVETLIELGYPEGWAVRDGKIVVWENAESVPDELQDVLKLD